MTKYLIAYFASLMAFLVIDGVWLGFIARSFYADRLRPLLLDQPNFAAAGLFYAAYVIGIVYFAVAPGLRENSLQITLINGALLGLVAYATYDMSNLATLRGWSIEVVIVDIVWGAFISAAVAAAGYSAARTLAGA